MDQALGHASLLALKVGVGVPPYPGLHQIPVDEVIEAVGVAEVGGSTQRRVAVSEHQVVTTVDEPLHRCHQVDQIVLIASERRDTAMVD